MTTLASDAIKSFAGWWDTGLDYPSATLSGIVGDKAHQKGGGYHISIEDNSPSNYSVVRPGDKAPPGWWSRKHASAVDMSMNKADMVKAWNRVYAVWVNHADPRRKYFNAFNGWNGVGEAERLDFIANTRKVTTPDHKWHCHDETPRMYYNDPKAFEAKLSVYAGEGMDAYIARTSGGGGMPTTLENIDLANWSGGTSMGPAVPTEDQALEQPPAEKQANGHYGNSQNDRLLHIQRMLEKVLSRLDNPVPTPVSVSLSAEALDSLASSVGETVANAVVSDGGNALTDADLANVRSVAVSAAKQALREGGIEA